MEQLEKKERNYKVLDVVSIVVVLAIFGVTFFLPKSGDKVLLNEILEALALLLFGGFTLVKAIVQGKNTTGKTLVSRILIIGICLVIGVLIGKDVVLDMSNGPKTETISITSVTSMKSRKSFLATYHVKGYDENRNMIRLEVSEEDANILAKRRQAKLKYYPNTQRLIEIK